jgi:nucleoside-diphosphate-sugar epimerase
MNVLALASAWQAYLVYLSSIQVIGRPIRLPITEEHPAAPCTTYHATKLFGEQVLRATGVASAALRLTSPVGPGMPDDRIVAVFARRAAHGETLMIAGEGARTQDYVNVEDVAEAVAACLDRRVSGVYNIGAGVSVSNLDLARLCVRTLGSSSRIELTGRPDPEENARWEVDIHKARTALGYEPRPNLPAVIRAVAREVRA